MTEDDERRIERRLLNIEGGLNELRQTCGYYFDDYSRKIPGIQQEITKLHREVSLTKSELAASKRKMEMQIRNLEIRDAVINREIPAKDVAASFKLSAARISQIVNAALTQQKPNEAQADMSKR